MLFVRQNKNKKISLGNSKLFLVNSITIALLVINHIKMLPLSYHLFKKRDIKIFDIT